MIRFKIQHQYFLDIKLGRKIAEGRIAKQKYTTLKPNEIIEFISNENNESIKAIVIAVNKYKSFEEMLEAEKVQTMLPDIKDTDQGVSIYKSFGNYRNEVINFGCVAIRFKLK